MSFYEALSRYYDEVFPLDMKRVTLIKDLISGGSRILDLGCGTGTLVKALNREGYEAYGLDADPEMIRLASDSVFRLGDLRDLSGYYEPGSFDSVLCLGNTLVHLDSDREILESLKQMRSLLKKRGLLIVQILNYDFITSRKISELPLIETSSLLFRRRYAYCSSDHIEFSMELTEKKTGKSYSSALSLHPLGEARLRALLEKAGFHVHDLYGSFDKEPLSENSIPLIVLAY